MKISFSNPAAITSGVVVVGVNEGNKLSSSAASIDKASGGSLVRAIKASTFKGKKGQQLSIMTPAGTKFDRVLLLGLGKPKDMGLTGALNAGGAVYAALAQAGAASVAEIAATGRAAIFIPFPASLDDHQTFNAKSLTDENAAILVTQKEAENDPTLLTKEILSLITNPQKCKQMAAKAKKLAHRDALSEIIETIVSCQKSAIGSAK